MKKWIAAEIVELNIAETAHHNKGNHQGRGDHQDKDKRPNNRDHENNPFPPTSTPIPTPDTGDSDILS